MTASRAIRPAAARAGRLGLRSRPDLESAWTPGGSLSASAGRSDVAMGSGAVSAHAGFQVTNAEKEQLNRPRAFFCHHDFIVMNAAARTTPCAVRQDLEGNYPGN